MESFGGQLRTSGVYVGKYDMPLWEEVPFLLKEWERLVETYDHRIKKEAKMERERIALMLHDLFLCVHPFRDGNGRTSRILLNALRVRWGLPWLIIDSNKKRYYYRHIEQTQQKIFRVAYPDVFP